MEFERRNINDLYMVLVTYRSQAWEKKLGGRPKVDLIHQVRHSGVLCHVIFDMDKLGN